MSLTCVLLVLWSLTEEVAGSSHFNVRTNIFVTEFSVETFRENSIEIPLHLKKILK